jgi:hypothetical protein
MGLEEHMIMSSKLCFLSSVPFLEAMGKHGYDVD